MHMGYRMNLPHRHSRWFRTTGAAIITMIASTLVTSFAHAEGLASLQAFVKDTRAFTAGFEQTLYDADSTPLQVSTGTIQLKRPGRFLWKYETPNKQQLLSDGEKIWLYDEDLEQVTVNDLSDKVSGTPLVILMGTRPLEEEFVIEVRGPADNIEWFELTPRTESADFESLFVGLNDQGLAAMELRDNFGQATQIVFSDMNPDANVPDSIFDFKAPPGVDVIGQ